jgi:hypothetical protein
MLWRSFGSVPFQETLYEPPYVGPQLSPDEIYAQIIKDVDASIASFKDAKSKYSTNDGVNNGPCCCSDAESTYSNVSER